MRVSDNSAQTGKVNIEQATTCGRARRACVVLFVAALFLIGLGLYQAPSTSVHAAPTSPTAAPGQPTATKFGKLATVLPEPTGTASPDGTFAGWERVALHDVAEVVGWPTTVAY